MHSLRSPIHLACLLLPAFLLAADDKDAPVQLPGMSQQITVQKAAALGVAAAEGEYVAVLDQSAAQTDTARSKAQDHNYGSLQLSDGAVEGDSITVTGKYYVPSNSEYQPASIRLTLRKQTKEGLILCADKSIQVPASDFDHWVDFDLELTLTTTAEGSPGNFVLLLSAAPLAGPVYLDSLGVFNAAKEPLWPLPSFE